MPRSTEIKGKIMGINDWYWTPGTNTGSSYTDFLEFSNENDSSYTDFTLDNNYRAVRKPRVNWTGGTKKNGSAGKVLLGSFIAIALVAAFTAGAWYFSGGENNDNNFFSSVPKIIAGGFAVGGNMNAEVKDPNQIKAEERAKATAERFSYSKSGSAYKAAENLVEKLKCGNDVDTAYEIFNWVHSHVSYMPVHENLTFEEAAYRGFSQKNGDCFVSFACSKMLLDAAGIENLAVERYPIITVGHYWNLVKLDGEWYHCDATVFKDHPALYFMCTDDEIADSHHEFDASLYPERAKRNNGDNGNYGGYADSPYVDDYSDDYSGGGDYSNDYSDDYSNDYSDDYVVGPNYQPDTYPGIAPSEWDNWNDAYGDVDLEE